MKVVSSDSPKFPQAIYRSIGWLVILGGYCGVIGCSTSLGGAGIARVSAKTELPGGPHALGDIGDFILQNDLISVVVEGQEASRSVFYDGGTIIDASLNSRDQPRYLLESFGGDHFGLLNSAFFLATPRPTGFAIVPEADRAFTLRVAASPGRFLSVTQPLSDLAIFGIFSHWELTVDYTIRPGVPYIEVTNSIRNSGNTTQTFPALDIGTLLGDPSLNLVPALGAVTILGGGSRDFIPGVAGFDTRFATQDALQSGVPFPALPGVIADFVASKGDGVSYGIFMDPIDTDCDDAIPDIGCNFPYSTRALYPTDIQAQINRGSMVVPLSAQGALLLFMARAPKLISAGETFSWKYYFVVGDGDIAAVRDQMHQVRGDPVGIFTGRIIDDKTFEPIRNLSVVVTDHQGHALTEISTNSAGIFRGLLPPTPDAGTYYYSLVGEDYTSKGPIPFTISAGEAYPIEETLERPGLLVVRVTDDDGQRPPAKVTLVRQYDADLSLDDGAGNLPEPRRYAFNLQIGEPFRHTELLPDNVDDPETRTYIEKTAIARAGLARIPVRPGTYRVVVSRGPEYERVDFSSITIASSQIRSLEALLRRAIDTRGYIAADPHLHALHSADSGTPLRDRVLSAAAEGVEWAVATDHNYVTDYGPSIDSEQLSPWINSSVGIELTNFENGHINAYPLRYDPKSPVNQRGLFVNSYPLGDTPNVYLWARVTPQDIFQRLRELGALGERQTIIQVNHVFDGFQGYFANFDLDVETMAVHDRETLGFPLSSPEFKADNFSFDFDAIEILNGKRIERMFTARVPDALPSAVPDCFRVPGKAPLTGAPLRTYLDGDVDRDQDGDVDAGDIAACQSDAGCCQFSDQTFAYPGELDVWYQLLSRVPNPALTRPTAPLDQTEPWRPATSLAVSDSHAALGDAPGSPRTYLRVPDDRSLAGVTQDQIVDAILNHRAISTNGPFIELFVNGATIGSVVEADNPVNVEFHLQSASWIKPIWIVIKGNATPDNLDGLINGLRVAVDLRDLPPSCTDHRPDTAVTDISCTFSLTLVRDTWLVAEVLGWDIDQIQAPYVGVPTAYESGTGLPDVASSLWPAVEGEDIPFVQLGDSIGTLAASFGLSVNFWKDLTPVQVRLVYPFAVTNPIWVSIDGTPGFQPPLPPLSVRRASPQTPHGCEECERARVKRQLGRNLIGLFNPRQ